MKESKKKYPSSLDEKDEVAYNIHEINFHSMAQSGKTREISSVGLRGEDGTDLDLQSRYRRSEGIHNIVTRATTALATALALSSSVMAQEAPNPPVKVVAPGESHTRILGPGESPVTTIVLSGGSATTEKGGMRVTATTGPTTPVSSPTNVTKRTIDFSTPSPSVSATAPADKGGGQVVDIGGKKMSFSEIAALPKVEKDTILDGKMSDEQLKGYQIWRDELKQAANQRKVAEVTGEQAANQRKVAEITGEQAANQRKIAEITDEQAAIDEIISRVPSIIPVYEARIVSGKKLSMEQKEILVYLVSLGKPPGWLPRIKIILDNPKNFA